MRSLGGFLWCALFLLQSVRAADPQPCNPPWRIPENEESCTQIIKWKVHNVEQATATCQEYFPTTFAYGEVQGDKIECTVYRQFQCEFQQGSFSIFDKCYYFPQTTEVTLEDYLDPAKPAAKCPAGGKLPVFLTMSQAKHIAKRARMEGIAKMWVNLGRDGRLIEDVNKDLVKGFMLHKDLWKLHKETWWNGEKMEKSAASPNSAAENLFFRTDTDYVRNLWQGNFELATKQAKATVVCEYPANIVPKQERYCQKLGKQGLGLNAIYDDKNDRKRCLYTSLTKYPMKGTKEAIEQFPGCKESPSDEVKAGLDDGTASKAVYDQLAAKGTYRVAAIKADTSLVGGENEYMGEQRGKCQTGSYSQDTREKHRQPWLAFDRFMKPQYTRVMSSPWGAEYPMNECSDFPKGEMDSNTLAIRNKEIIDVPVPVRFHAICSIEYNVDCNMKQQTCRSDEKCTDIEWWNAKTQMYTKCECHQFHDDISSVCKWTGNADARVCGRGLFYDNVASNTWHDIRDRSGHGNNKLVRVVVRQGCKMTVWSHPLDSDYFTHNTPLLNGVPYGEYEVPNHLAGTLNGWHHWMSASDVQCTC